MKKYYFILVIILSSSFLLSCGAENNNIVFGTITAQIQWPEAVQNRSAEIDILNASAFLHKTAPAGVITVRAIVTGQGMGTIQQDFTASAGSGTINNVPAGTNRSLTIQGIDSGGTVTHEGTVTNITVNGGQNTSAGFVTMALVGGSTPPPAPTGVTAVGGDTVIDVSWNYVSTADDGYRVYINDSPAVSTTNYLNYHDISNPSTTSMTWTGVTNGTTYYCIVTASNPAGESPPSATVSATPQAAGSPPATPTGLTLTPGDTVIDVSWNAVANADGYIVYIHDSSNISTTNNLNSADHTDTSMTWNNCTNGTTYYVAVLAYNIYGNSPLSAPVSATPQAALPAPTGVVAFGGDQQVILTWNEVPGATGYHVYYSSSPGVTTSSTVSAYDSPPPRTFYDIPNGDTRYYIVTAITATTESTPSVEVSTTASTAFTAIADVAFDYPGLRWITAGDALWVKENTYHHNGISSMRSGAIGDNGWTRVQTYLDGPINISFWWKVSSESCCDKLVFSMDGIIQSTIGGEQDWTYQTLSIPSGTHFLRWTYSKDDAVSSGFDAGFIDDISLY